MKQREGRKAARVLGAAIGVQFFSGILYVWSVFKDHLIARYQWTDAEATIPYTIANIVFALSMFMAGLILPKTSARLMITVGTGMLGLGLVLSAFAITPWMWVITMGFIVSAGIGINNLVATPAAICWYPPSKRGSIIGLVVAGVAIAPVMYSPLTSFLFKTVGLTWGSIVLGLLVFLIPLPLAQLIASPPDDFIPAGTSTDKAADSSNTEVSCRQMIRKPEFYKLFVMFAFSASAGLILFGHLTRIVRLQANWEGGFFLLMLLAVFNAAGRFMGGAASDRMGNADKTHQAKACGDGADLVFIEVQVLDILPVFQACQTLDFIVAGLQVFQIGKGSQGSRDLRELAAIQAQSDQAGHILHIRKRAHRVLGKVELGDIFAVLDTVQVLNTLALQIEGAGQLGQHLVGGVPGIQNVRHHIAGLAEFLV